MIELTEEQRRELDRESPSRVVNPRTQERFVLIREDVYEIMRKLVGPLNRNWDNPQDDGLIEKK